eukprot:4057439-Pyramimonas_sp.AAC.1
MPAGNLLNGACIHTLHSSYDIELPCPAPVRSCSSMPEPIHELYDFRLDMPLQAWVSESSSLRVCASVHTTAQTL